MATVADTLVYLIAYLNLAGLARMFHASVPRRRCGGQVTQ